MFFHIIEILIRRGFGLLLDKGAEKFCKAVEEYLKTINY